METKNKLSRYWHFSIVSMLVLFIALMPELANAAVLGDALCAMNNIVQGTSGKAIAIAAIIILGLMALMGKISWGLGILVVLGIGLMFGAGEIAGALGGGDVCGGTTTTTTTTVT